MLKWLSLFFSFDLGLLILPLPSLAGDMQCKQSPVTEEAAVASLLKEVRDSGEWSDPEKHRHVFYEDVNHDGIPDLFVTFECGNHSCQFHPFLGVGQGKYCRLEGTVAMTAGGAKRIIRVLPQSGSNNIDLIVFEGASGVNGGAIAQYRFQNQVVYLVCEIDYEADSNPPETIEERYKEALEGAIEKAEQCPATNLRLTN